jgi:hypothetical protein
MTHNINLNNFRYIRQTNRYGKKIGTTSNNQGWIKIQVGLAQGIYMINELGRIQCTPSHPKYKKVA